MKQQTLKQAWDDYTRQGQSMNLAKNTMNGRSWALKKFVLQYGDRKIGMLSDQHLTPYLLRCAETRGDSSMALTEDIIGAFFNWCVKTGRLNAHQNPMLSRRRRKVQTRDHVRIPVHRWTELLKHAEMRDPRDRMVVALGLHTLLRDQEMAAIRIGEVDLSTGCIRAEIFKTNDWDDVPITADLDYELRRWYISYQNKVGPLDKDMLLLPARQHGPAGRGEHGRFQGPTSMTYDPYAPISKCARIVTPLYETMGYPTTDESGRSTRMGAHTLRRSGARSYYDYFVGQGVSDALRQVQTMLHHANADMTQKYIGLREDRETRDNLLRGVTIFGLHNLSQIGSVAGDGLGEATAQIV